MSPLIAAWEPSVNLGALIFSIVIIDISTLVAATLANEFIIRPLKSLNENSIF